MKKVFIIIIFIITLFSAEAFATPISGTGYGKTAEAARNSALSELSNQIVINISTVSLFKSYEDGESSLSDFFSTQSIQRSDSELLGVQFTTDSENGLFKVVATIPESSSTLYISHLKELSDSINRIADDIKNLSKEEQLEVYPFLLSLFREHSITMDILNILSPSSYIEKPLAISKAEVEFKYRLLLSKAIAESNMQLESMTALASVNLISENSEEMQSIINAHEELLKKRKLLQDEMDSEYILRIQQEQEIVREELSSTIARISLYEDTEADIILNSLMNFEAKKMAFVQLKENLEDSVKNLELQYINEVENIIKEIVNMPFYESQLDGNGIPKSMIVDSIERITQKQLDEILQEYCASATAIYLTSYEKLDMLSKSMHEEAKKIKNRQFSISNRDYAITTSILPEDFDSEKLKWDGIAYISIGNETIDVPFSIPYKDWTNQEVIDIDSISSMMSTYSDIDFWTKIFTEYPSSFTISFIGHYTNMAEDNNQYSITFDGYTITRNDTGSIIVNVKTNIDRVIHSSADCDIDDFTIEHDFLLRNYEEG